MTRSRLGRRALLGTAGASALTLPFTKLLGSRAKAQATPKRFIVFFVPNGTVQEQWFPTGTEKEFTLGQISGRLDPFREHLVFFRGLDIGTRDLGPGLSHDIGMGHALTASELLPATADTPKTASSGLASGISIDQAIADHIGADTPFRSLELGVLTPPSFESPSNRMIYRGDGVALAPENDPVRVYERLFGNQLGDPAAALKRRARKQSVIDFAKADFANVEKRLGKREVERLESHKEGVLAIEKRLGLVGTCAAPGMPGGFDPYREEDMGKTGQAHIDLMMQAFACDLTRVASIQWTYVFAYQWFAWLGLPALTATMGHHLLSHDIDNFWPDFKNSLIKIYQFYMDQFAYLLNALATTPEPDGSGFLIDNTCVLLTSEIARGSHELVNMPWLVAGNAGGAWEKGRSLVLNGEGHQKLLVSIAQAYGIESDVFGDPRAESGTLSAL
jgi:hypothetical protein